MFLIVHPGGAYAFVSPKGAAGSFHGSDRPARCSLAKLVNWVTVVSLGAM